MMKVRWGVLGVGRAGKARVAALRADPRAELVGGWRGDPGAVGLHTFQSVEDMLQHVDAVAICSPDHYHASQVHSALSAYRHVICEFPVAGSAGEASSLFALSVARDRVLHVEHIELLTPTARWIRKFAPDQTLIGGSLSFNGGLHSGATSPAHANIARFQRIIDAIGVPEDVSIQRCTPNNLGVKLLYPGDVTFNLDCRMEEGLERRMEMVLEFQQGIVRQESGRVFLDGKEVELESSPGLFKADQLAATAAILDGEKPYISMERVLDGLAVADLVMGVS
jgi:hypothetical protein